MKGAVRDPFIPDSSPIVGATGRSPLRRVLGANFSHLGVISNDVTAAAYRSVHMGSRIIRAKGIGARRQRRTPRR